MELKQDTKTTLEKIDFIARYKNLSNKYAFDFKERFNDFRNDAVIEIFNELGYHATFDKKEKFFKVVEITTNYKFQFNISLKSGGAELIWAIWRDEEFYDCSTWGVMKTKLDGNHDDKVRLPIFRNYEDLKEILSEAFSIYEDFKREFLVINDISTR